MSHRPRKTVIVILAVLLCIGLYSFNESTNLLDDIASARAVEKDTVSSEEASTIEPLLGAHEDPSKLWYPSQSTSSYPKVATYNVPHDKPSRQRTPLFIGFSRNYAMLRQTVLSFIAAGWPRDDIVVVDNSGTFDANSRGELTPENAFYLNYDLLRSRYGVSIMQTPTMLSFPQLQNFYLRTSMAHNWTYFFWAHQDIAVMANETRDPYKSFHQRALGVLRDAGAESLKSPVTDHSWAVKFFAFDWLALINVESWRTIGQWDTFIPYYNSDCDAYARVSMNNFTKDDVSAGAIYDLASALPDPETQFFPDPSIHHLDPEASLNSRRYQALQDQLEAMQAQKPSEHRNTWQTVQKGGRQEPFTYHLEGFQEMWWQTALSGQALFKKKWGSASCDLVSAGVVLADEWKPRKD